MGWPIPPHAAAASAAASAIARSEGVQRVMLTSNAARRAAHRLYERMGFVRYETDCFRCDL